jgi:hypothetical protein
MAATVPYLEHALGLHLQCELVILQQGVQPSRAQVPAQHSVVAIKACDSHPQQPTGCHTTVLDLRSCPAHAALHATSRKTPPCAAALYTYRARCSPACLIVTASEAVVEVAQPHNVVVLWYAAHAAPVPTAAAGLPIGIPCTPHNRSSAVPASAPALQTDWDACLCTKLRPVRV